MHKLIIVMLAFKKELLVVAIYLEVWMFSLCTMNACIVG